jgi:hypothetical protein
MPENDEPIFNALANINTPDRGDLGLPVVHLETEMFDAWAIAFFAMPAMRIIEVMLVPEELRTPAFTELLKLALQDPGKTQDLEILTFRELQKLIGTWLILSNKLERQKDGDLSIEREDTP